MTDETLPIAAGAGILVLLLAGGGYALMRRRRPGEEEYYATDEVAASQPTPERDAAMAEAMAVGAMAPATVAPATMAAVAEETPRSTGEGSSAAYADQPVATPEGFDTLANVPTADVPDGFDMSRYGRHVQAAYRGPTADNPSLSLKRRLARARFFDQRERLAAQGVPTAPIANQPRPSAQPAQPAREGDYVTTRVNRPQRPGFRPAYSS